MVSFLGSLKLEIDCLRVNPLPNNKSLDLSKLKAFAEDKLELSLNVTKHPHLQFDRN